MITLRPMVLLAASVVALSTLGCATVTADDASENAAAAALADEPILIFAADDFELHYRNGEVVAVRPNADGPALSPTEERVRTYREFKDMYELRNGTKLPAVLPPDGVDVTGWRGLECVRPGKACGAQPAEPPANQAARIKLKFGR